MKRHPFTLHPFISVSQNTPNIRLTGCISRASQTIAICYELSGEFASLDWPAFAEHPERRNFLWEKTCFELFVKKKDSKGYWEINLSPAGHWNIFWFDVYRKGMREEMEIAAPIIHVDVDDNHPGVRKVSTDIHLEGIITAGQPIRVAVSAIIKTIRGKIYYWALTHPGPGPDFHHREGFLLKL